jgi:hypothetical protein
VSPSYTAGFRFQDDLRRIQHRVLVAGVLLLAASVVGAFFSPNDFFRGYLIGYLLWLGAALGSMAYLMIQYVTGGTWGVVSRRVLEAATRTLPVLAILFIPVGLGIGNLYEWAHPDLVRSDSLLRHRSGYMNPVFFFARAGIYLVVWMVFAHFLNRWSTEEDDFPRKNRSKLKTLSVPGLIVLLFSISFAAVDWTESLETRWASTMWGLMFIAAQGLTAMAFLIIIMSWLYRREPMSEVLTADHFHDLGKLLFANLMLWAYFAFCQYLIIWAENLTNEIPYYITRTRTSWGWFGVALIVFNFFVPMLLLLNRNLKRNAYLLSVVAVIILVMRYMDVIWIVLPAYYKEGFRIGWTDVTTPFGLAGLWLWAYLRELPRRPLIAASAPELEMALAHETD